MAPEVLGFFSGNDPAVAYSVSVDIWAIGIITVELLLKLHPFPNVSDLVSYVHGTKALELDSGAGANLSDDCRDFISGLLTPDPVTRPSASAAAAHSWLIEETAAPASNPDES